MPSDHLEEEISREAANQERLARTEAENQVKPTMEQISAAQAELKDTEKLQSLTGEVNRLKKEIKSLQSEIAASRLEISRLRNSIRFKFGGYFVSAAKPSINTLKLPWRIIKLFYDWYCARSGAKQQRPAHIPEAADRAAEDIDASKPIAAVILDEFSYSSFRPEANLITFRPDNWLESIERKRIDLLFVESAWRGNQGAWQYKIASYKNNLGDELLDLIDYFKGDGIPTVFWNKEDPVHFERFINKARKFDLIFTTDESCIPKYIERTGNSKIFALPFAAQPRIHNPLLTEPRDRAVCFAGTYYASRHEQRQDDMDCLLKPALDYGLDIFDRRHGYVGKDADQFRFPHIYQSAIRGRLEYSEMVKAYKRYKCFLNVNSVRGSGTMFSRRIFELLASGTPVISSYSLGIEKLLGNDLVLFSDSVETTRSHLDKILSDEDFRNRLAVKGIRRVLQNHTYSHRLNEILLRTGISRRDIASAPLVVANCSDGTDLLNFLCMLKAQSYRGAFRLLLLHPEDLDTAVLNRFDADLPSRISTRLFPFLEKGLEACYKELRRSTAPLVVFLKSGSVYGKHYLEDIACSETYSPFDFIGRHTYYSCQDSDNFSLCDPDYEFRLVTSAPTATVSARKDCLNQSTFLKILNHNRLQLDEAKILSIHRFGFLEDNFGYRPDSIPDEIKSILDQ